MSNLLNGLKKFRKNPTAITIEELYQNGIIPEYDEQRECYYFQDPVTDKEITPCLMDIRILEKYLNEHPEVLKKLSKLDNGEIEEDILKAA